MTRTRDIHPDFLSLLMFKEKALVDLFIDLRSFVLDIYPDSNEILYHTHALTAVFSISDKLSDGFCMLPIYTNTVNLGFHKGTLLDDPHRLLRGTGNLIRHMGVSNPADYRNIAVESLVRSAVGFAIGDMDKPATSIGETISRINVK